MAGVVLANRESLRHLVNKIDVCDHKQLASNVIDKYECATKNKDTAYGYDFYVSSDTVLIFGGFPILVSMLLSVTQLFYQVLRSHRDIGRLNPPKAKRYRESEGARTDDPTQTRFALCFAQYCENHDSKSFLELLSEAYAT